MKLGSSGPTAEADGDGSTRLTTSHYDLRFFLRAAERARSSFQPAGRGKGWAIMAGKFRGLMVGGGVGVFASPPRGRGAGARAERPRHGAGDRARPRGGGATTAA